MASMDRGAARRRKEVVPRRVVVTGIGVVSPVGTGKEEFFSALLRGQSGVRAITRFDTTGYPVRILSLIHI